MVLSQVIPSQEVQTEIIDSIDMAPLLSRISDKLGMSFSSSAVGTVLEVFYEFKVWGAGGSGGTDSISGGGAYVTGQYQFQPGTTLKFVVGAAGAYPIALNESNYGAGGPKGTTYTYDTGSGGGLSGVFITTNQCFTSSTASPTAPGLVSPAPSAAPLVQPGATIANVLLVAAGGGSNAGGYPNAEGYGGGGGITAGGNTGNTDPATGGTWGGAGTDSGSGGISDAPGTNGGLFYGGHSTGGGGGGSGFYGGGGGGNSSKVSGGAGGSSYYTTTQPKPSNLVGYNPGSATGTAGQPGISPTPSVAGNASDPVNGGSYGGGGGNTSRGQNGLIAYRKASSYANLSSASWVLATYTGSDQTIIVP
jgi:hypothetical protein